jgi:hypothetical protein
VLPHTRVNAKIAARKIFQMLDPILFVCQQFIVDAGILSFNQFLKYLIDDGLCLRKENSLQVGDHKSVMQLQVLIVISNQN